MLKEKFFDTVTETLFYGSLPSFQRVPLEELYNAAVDNHVYISKQDIPKLAYIFATAYHESNRFKAKEEYGRGNGKRYGQRVPLWSNKTEGYYGRGWVQLTWLGNYGQMTARLSALTGQPVDLVNDPGIITRNDWINAWITVVGMKEGLFTGKKLEDYIGRGKVDYLGARRVVNGTDRAELIAGYAKKFEEALNL
jgi:hypothetical protein